MNDDVIQIKFTEKSKKEKSKFFFNFNVLEKYVMSYNIYDI